MLERNERSQPIIWQAIYNNILCVYKAVLCEPVRNPSDSITSDMWAIPVSSVI